MKDASVPSMCGASGIPIFAHHLSQVAFGREPHVVLFDPRLPDLDGVEVTRRIRERSPRQFLRQVWGPFHDDPMGHLRVYMKKLRYKIEAEPAQPKYVAHEIGDRVLRVSS